MLGNEKMNRVAGRDGIGMSKKESLIKPIKPIIRYKPRRCSYCKAKVEVDWFYCPYCGELISDCSTIY
jgi:rRNA maturation endonuclease Nob1